MGGVVAILNRVGEPVQPETLSRMLQEMAWRGTDHRGHWVSRNIGLAAVQHWTVPEDVGTSQPLQDTSGRWCVFDGRIDNRPELLELLNHQVRARQVSDAGLALAAFDKWGPDSVMRLVGPFALVIWDAVRSRLFAARDPVGLRTMFYCAASGRFVLASSTHALRVGGFVQAIDEDYMWEYLSTSFRGPVRQERTPFRNVFRIPPGHWLLADRVGLEIKAFWKPSRLIPIHYKQEVDYADHLRELLGTVVSSQLRAISP